MTGHGRIGRDNNRLAAAARALFISAAIVAWDGLGVGYFFIFDLLMVGLCLGIKYRGNEKTEQVCKALRRN